MKEQEKTLLRKKPEIEEKEKRLEEAKRAEKVRVFETGLLQAEEAVGRSKRSIEELTEQLSASEIQVRELREIRVQREEELAKQEKECKAELIRIQDALPRYAEVEQLKNYYDEEKKKQELRKGELEKHKKALDDMKQEIISIASVMAGKVVAASINTTVQDALIDETLKEMGESTWQS